MSKKRGYPGLLSDDDLHQVISETVVEMVEAIERARARKRSLAIQASPLSARQTRQQKRAKAKRAVNTTRPCAPLTPYASRMVMIKSGFTQLDSMLEDDQARALERWAICAQLIEGKAKTVNYSGGGTGGEHSPIPDDWIHAVNRYMRSRAAMDAFALQILDAFSALQNNDPGALSIAGYGCRFFPNARHKRDAFLCAIRDAANVLLRLGH